MHVPRAHVHFNTKPPVLQSNKIRFQRQWPISFLCGCFVQLPTAYYYILSIYLLELQTRRINGHLDEYWVPSRQEHVEILGGQVLFDLFLSD